MKLINIIEGQDHTMIACYQETNSFGDQIITLRFESHNGFICEKTDTYPEGYWIDSAEALGWACAMSRPHRTDKDQEYFDRDMMINGW